MPKEILNNLYELVKERAENPIVGSYTNYLLSKGEDKICLKIGEQATELILALKNHERDEVLHEAADMLYHMTVALAISDITWDEVAAEMRSRRRTDEPEIEELIKLDSDSVNI